MVDDEYLDWAGLRTMGDHQKVAHKVAGTFRIIFFFLVVATTVCTLFPSILDAQSAIQVPAVPQWEVDAGGKMEFEVASVRLNTSGTPPSGDMPYSNFPLGAGDVYSPNGGLFTATNFPFLTFISFAYKMSIWDITSVESQLPKWATTYRFNMQARAQGNPTKDQMRLMMQSLLADRFKLIMHKEIKQVAVFALLLLKPGKFGPKLRTHPEGAPCSTAPPAPGTAPVSPPIVDGEFPSVCGSIVVMQPSVPGRVRLGARNIRLDGFTIGVSGLDPSLNRRPVIDQTGLTGTFDLAIEWTFEPNGPLPAGSTFVPDPSGPTFLQALKEQLGLKLDSQTGPSEVIVIDRLEQLSEN